MAAEMLDGPEGPAVYHVSKLAIRSFTREVAIEELDRNICIISFGPGGPAGETPEEIRDSAAQIDMELGMRVVAAAEAPMELSGRMVAVRDGKLGLAADEITANPPVEGREAPRTLLG